MFFSQVASFRLNEQFSIPSLSLAPILISLILTFSPSRPFLPFSTFSLPGFFSFTVLTENKKKERQGGKADRDRRGIEGGRSRRQKGARKR
jgi:hypothetical protein